MEQKIKRTISLPEGITSILSENLAIIRKLETERNVYNQRVSDLMTGVCLSNGIDLKLEGISFSEDLKSLNIYDLPKNPEEQTVEPQEKSPKRRKKSEGA